LETIKSRAPPLKLPPTTSVAPSWTVIVKFGVACANVSLFAGLPKKTITVPFVVVGAFWALTTATSSVPSPLKSSTQSCVGRTPVATSALRFRKVNVPFPFPLNIAIKPAAGGVCG
jgi:hypothetical protein